MQDNLREGQIERKPEPPDRPTGRVGQLLFVVQQAAQALAIDRLAPLGLSPRAWGVLSTLTESGPLTQIELATTMSIDRTAMVYLLDELEERSLVERVRHPQDRRAFLIHLTAAGQDVQRRAAAALAGAADTLLTPLDPAERVHLVDLLGKVAAHWQQVSAGQQEPASGGPRPAADRPRSAATPTATPAAPSAATSTARRGTRTPSDP
jgi:DNA-binding MarR family transcriptional regulator